MPRSGKSIYKMRTNAWIEYTSILVFFEIKVILTVSIKSIVRLQCEYFSPESKKCCIGTIVSPNYVLTTNYCALNCKSFTRGHREVKTTKMFTYPRKNIFNDNLSLLYFEDTKQNENHYLKLSAIDTTSAVGLKAFTPILDKKPRLQSTLIKKCVSLRSDYICTDKNVCRANVCGSEQGMPILLNGRVLGISGNTEISCRQPQKAFLGLEPAYAWIRSVVIGPHLSRRTAENNTKIQRHSGMVPEEMAEAQEMENEKGKNVSNNILIMTQPLLNILNTTKSNNSETLLKVTAPDINEVHNMVETVDSNTTAYLLESSTLESHTIGRARSIETYIGIYPPSPISVITLRSDITSTTWSTKQSSPVEVTTHDPRKAITADLSFLTTPIIKFTNAFEISSTKYKKNETSSNVTSVMDWFNQKVKQKLKKSPAPFLVLTTSVELTKPTTFVDLT